MKEKIVLAFVIAAGIWGGNYLSKKFPMA